MELIRWLIDCTAFITGLCVAEAVGKVLNIRQNWFGLLLWTFVASGVSTIVYHAGYESVLAASNIEAAKSEIAQLELKIDELNRSIEEMKRR